MQWDQLHCCLQVRVDRRSFSWVSHYPLSAACSASVKVAQLRVIYDRGEQPLPSSPPSPVLYRWISNPPAS